MRESSDRGLMLRTVVRPVVSLGVAAAVAELAWRQVPDALGGRTTSVGYPIAVDFDINRYTDAFVLVAGLIPAVAIAVFVLLSRVGPLRRTAPPDAALLPLVVAAAETGEAAERSDADAARGFGPLELFWAVARLALPALVVVVELSVATSSRQLGLSAQGYGGGALYLVVVAIVGLVLARSTTSGTRDRPGAAVLRSVAAVNGVAALVTVPLLYLVSRTTAVSVQSDHRVAVYPWLPWWAALVLTVAAVVSLLRWRRRSGGSLGADSESHVLVWIVGPVLLYLSLAALQGALGLFQGFDDAQYLASPQLLFGHGLFPWRDLYVIHGVLSDGLSAAPGLWAFGNTRRGGNSGLTVFAYPIFWLSSYFFAASICRKNRLFLIGLSMLIVVGTLQSNSPELFVIPLCLILLARVLSSPTWGRCATFTLGLFASAVLVPESTVIQVGVLPLVLLFDLATRSAGQSWRIACRRTLRCLVIVVPTVAAFVIYLAATRSLSAFVNFYLVYASDNAVIHGLPLQWSIRTNLAADTFFFGPVALWLLTIVRVTVKLVRRSTWLIVDWIMVAAALDAILYEVKVVQRADLGHVVQIFEACLPLLIVWVLEALSWLDTAIRSRLTARAVAHHEAPSGPTWRGWFSWRTPASVAALVAVAVLAPLPVSVLEHVPSHFHPSVPVEAASLPRLGYTIPGAVNTTEIANLGRLLDVYAGPTAPVMDFANEPGITYYLLNRVPATRFYNMAELGNLNSQQTAVSDLQASRPPVVIYASTDFGLPGLDGIPSMVRQYAVSTYLLDHYRPLASVQGQLVFLRDDLMAHRRPLPTLTPPAQTTNLYFSSLSCNLADIPNFLAVPAGVAARPHQRVSLVPTSSPGTWRVVIAPGVQLARDDYVVISSGAPLGDTSFALSNQVGAPPADEITFNALARSGSALTVDVGGCLQWHGFHTDSLYLTGTLPGGTTPTVQLVP